MRFLYKQENPGSWTAPSAIWETGRNRPGHAAQYVFPKRVYWGNKSPNVPALGAAVTPSDFCFELVFDYGEHDATTPTPAEAQPWTLRADPYSSFRSGFDVRCYRLCQRTLLFHRFTPLPGPTLARTTEFAYVLAGRRPRTPTLAQTSVEQFCFGRGMVPTGDRPDLPVSGCVVDEDQPRNGANDDVVRELVLRDDVEDLLTRTYDMLERWRSWPEARDLGTDLRRDRDLGH